MDENTLNTNDLTPKKIKIEEPETPQYGFNNFTLTPPEEIERRAKLSSIITYGKDDGDSHLVYSYIMIAGKEVLKESHFTLKIKQEVNTHNEFEVICPSEGFDERDELPFRNTRNYLGNKLTIGFKQFGKTASLFTGIITNISHKKVDGYPHIILKGKSPTILMEEGQVCRSFENQTLEEISKTITQGYPSDILDCDLRPLLKDKLLYTVQSESNFAFLQRLATRYGEWFYDSGEQLVFGSYGGKTIELMEEQDVYEFELSMQVLPQKFNYIGYDPNQAQNLSVDSSEVPVTRRLVNHFQQHAMQVSEDIYPNSPQSLYNHSLMENGKMELNSSVKRQKLSRQNVVCVEAKSNNPNVQLGDIVKLKAWVPGNSSFKSGEIPIESYRVTKITHHHEGVDGYYNTFTGIPMDNEVPPYMDEDVVPVGADQSAIITDNKDPKGIGRVRVQFPWQKATNDQTPWIRLVQPHAGGGKGFYFIPEISEEVMISFENNNAEKPFVLGTHYNGKAVSGYYTDGNDNKVIHTRSGTKIVMNDKEGSIFIEDPSGNTYFMDGKGNIKTNAPNNIEFTAGKDMILNIGNDLSIQVGNNKMETIVKDYTQSSENKTVSVMNDKTESVGETYKQTTGQSDIQTVTGDLRMRGSGLAILQGGEDIKISKDFGGGVFNSNHHQPFQNLMSKNNSEGNGNDKVKIEFGSNADKTVVSEKSLGILRSIGEETKNYYIFITSTARDPYNQARIMYDNVINKGLQEQRKTYKPPGQKVLDTYVEAKAQKKNREETIKMMEKKIKELGPSNVSRHCGDPKVINVFDIDMGKLSNSSSFLSKIKTKSDKVLVENGCYHVEISQ